MKVTNTVNEELNNLVYDNYYSDLEKIQKEWGMKLVDTKEVGDYKLFLAYFPENMEYQIGMAFKELPFSTPKAQEKIKMELPLKNIKKVLMEMKTVIIDWLEKHSSEITIGSHNEKKVFKYRRILKNMNLTVSDVFNATPFFNSPNEFWIFELKK